MFCSQGQQPPVYQWTQEHYHPHRHSPKFSSSRQDSVSTYEEVESLSSHQVSSVNSRSTSEGPSRIPSLASTGSSLDRSGDFAAISWKFGEGPTLVAERPSSASVSRSGSVASSSPSHSYSDSRHSERSSVSDGTHSEGDMQSDIAKWVDQSRKETARKHTNSGMTEAEVMKSNEAPEKSSKSQKQPSQPLLNMECGDVIAGSSGEDSHLTQETDRALALRLRNSSPAPSLSLFSRTASFDSSISSYSDLRNDIAWTPAEDVLMNLGFGGPDLGIPERFLRSWHEKMYTRRMENVRKLLRSHSSQSEPDYFYNRLHVMEKVQEEPDPPLSAAAPKKLDPNKLAAHDASPVVKKEKDHQRTQNLPFQSKHTDKDLVHDQQQAKQVVAQKSCDASTDTSDLSTPVFHHENSNKPKVLPNQTSVERLHQYRKRMMKAATVSNFGKTLAEMARSRKGGQHNMTAQPHKAIDAQQMQQDMQKRMNMAVRKPRSAGRGRRNKYFVKQSSLPVSLETLPEEEELGKPKVHDMRSQRSISLDTDEPFKHVPLKIVMEQPSVESREAMSRQGTCDIDIDEAIADVEVDQKLPDKIEKYLTVVKDIMESKDSGFENEPSQSGSPQQMSPKNAQGDGHNKMETVLSPQQPNISNKSVLHAENSQTKQKAAGKENKHPEESRKQEEDIDIHLGVNKKDCLEVLSTSSRTSSRSDESVLSENKSHPNSRRSSLSSEKSVGPRPSLVDMQEVFCQTIEEDDDSVFMASPDPSELVDCVCVCVQTSPDLLSPPLSPLECGFSFFDVAQRESKTFGPAARSNRIQSAGFQVNDLETDIAVPSSKPTVLVRTVSNACSQASLDASEPLLLDHPIKSDFTSNPKQPYQSKVDVRKDVVVENQIYMDASETKTSNEIQTNLHQVGNCQIQPKVQQVVEAEIVNPTERVKPANFFVAPDDKVSMTSLPTDDENSTEWPEMGQSPTLDEINSFVHDTSAGFMSDASDCLPESEEEQLAEKVTQLRRRRSLRPEWATPVKTEHQTASRTSSQVGESSSDGSEVSVERRTNMKVSTSSKQGWEVKSDQDDKASDTESTLSVVTDKWNGTGDSSPSSVYKLSQFVNANQESDKPTDLIRSNSDLLKRLEDSRATLSNLATPHTPLKRSMSVEALSPYFMRPRTMSERGPRYSELNLLDTGKHYNTVRGTASTGGFKSRIKMPMNTPEVLKLASMKLERLIHKGMLKPVTYDASFQEEHEEAQSQDHKSPSNPQSLQVNDSKQADKIRDDCISLPDKGNDAFATPHSYLNPTPTSDKAEKEQKTLRQNSNLSDRSHGSSDKSLQSPSTRPPSVPAIFTKGPTLESHDSLEVVRFSELGEEKRPPLRSRDFCAWSSQSSSSPSFLAIPSFHSPDLPDFESRPTTTSPSDLFHEPTANKPNILFSLPLEEGSDFSNIQPSITSEANMPDANLRTDMNTLNTFIPSQLVLSPISPRKLELLFEDTPNTNDSHTPMKEDSSEGDENKTEVQTGSDDNTEQYYSSTHHDIKHTIPLPKLTINENGSKVPTILHKLATIPTTQKDKQFTIHIEVPPLNYEEMNNNNNILDTGKQSAVESLTLSPKDMLDTSEKENSNLTWTSEKHYQAPYYWDIADSIPVFPLYRDGRFTSDIAPQNNPRNDNAMIPTFDEICSKAGRLIQNLERTAAVSEGFQPVDPAPVQTDEKRGSNGMQVDTSSGVGSNPHVVVISVVDHALEESNRYRWLSSIMLVALLLF